MSCRHSSNCCREQCCKTKKKKKSNCDKIKHHSLSRRHCKGKCKRKVYSHTISCGDRLDKQFLAQTLQSLPSIGPVRSCHAHRVLSMQQDIGPDVVSFVHGVFDSAHSLGAIVDVENGQCELSGERTWRVHAHLRETSDAILGLFESVTRLVPGCRLSSVDLFHCHVILLAKTDGNVSDCDWRRFALLFHAFEYPADAGVNLGFCQRTRGASKVSIRNPSFRKRNVLCSFPRNELASAELKVLPILAGASGGGGLCTRYAEEFGLELGEIVLANLGHRGNAQPFPVLYPIRSALFPS
jgi:hypothetical protein